MRAAAGATTGNTNCRPETEAEPRTVEYHGRTVAMSAPAAHPAATISSWGPATIGPIEADGAGATGDDHGFATCAAPTHGAGGGVGATGEVGATAGEGGLSTERSKPQFAQNRIPASWSPLPHWGQCRMFIGGLGLTGGAAAGCCPTPSE